MGQRAGILKTLACVARETISDIAIKCVPFLFAQDDRSDMAHLVLAGGNHRGFSDFRRGEVSSEKTAVDRVHKGVELGVVLIPLEDRETHED